MLLLVVPLTLDDSVFADKKGKDNKNNLTKLVFMPPIGPALNKVRLFPLESEKVSKISFNG